MSEKTLLRCQIAIAALGFLVTLTVIALALAGVIR